MMANGSLGDAQGLRNMDDDFGIIPYPKFGSDDEYASIINGHAPLAVIPITVSDASRTGAITEALCAYGSKYVIPAFYEVSLKTKYARDEESEEIMVVIKDSIVYDIGSVAGGPLQSVGRDIAIMTTHDFSSFYAARESSAKKSVEEFNKDYGGLFQLTDQLRRNRHILEGHRPIWQRRVFPCILTCRNESYCQLNQRVQ